MNGRGISNNGHNLSAFCPQTNLLICKERNARLPKEWKLILYSEEKEILALKAFTPLLLKRFFCNWFTLYGLWSSLMKQKCYGSLCLFCERGNFFSFFSTDAIFRQPFLFGGFLCANAIYFQKPNREYKCFGQSFGQCNQILYVQIYIFSDVSI